MAKLRAVLDSLDDVPENIRELYAEKDGKFFLDAEGVEDVSGLKSTLEKLKREAKEAKSALAQYDGFDPEEYQRLKEAAESAEAQKLQTEGKWEEIKERLTKSHEKELEKRHAEIQKRDRVIERLTIENELNNAIEKAGVLSEHRKAVRALLSVEAKPTVVWDGDEVRGTMGDVSIAEYVEAWAQTDEAAYYLPPVGGGGSGAKAGASSGGGGVRSRKDLKTDADKARYIGEHGSEAYLSLPAE